MDWWHRSYADFIVFKPLVRLACWLIHRRRWSVEYSPLQWSVSNILRNFVLAPTSLSFVLRNQPTFFDVSLLRDVRRREKVWHVKLNPSAHLGRQNTHQQHIFPAYFAQGTYMCFNRDTGLTSQTLLEPSLWIAPFRFNMEENSREIADFVLW